MTNTAGPAGETALKLQRLRALLQKTVTRRDPLTGKTTEAAEPTELQKLYDAKKAIYAEARQAYEARRIAALAATDPAAIHDWATNAAAYREPVQSAMADWESNGFKMEVETVTALMAQIERRQDGSASIDGLVERVSQIEAKLAATPAKNDTI